MTADITDVDWKFENEPEWEALVDKCSLIEKLNRVSPAGCTMIGPNGKQCSLMKVRGYGIWMHSIDGQEIAVFPPLANSE